MSGNIRYTLHISDRLVGRTIQRILQTELKFSTRLLRNDETRRLVTRNGEFTYLNQRVIEGDEIHVMLPAESSKVTAEPIPIDIKYEDEEVLVVNKPAGILTHPTARERTGSLLAGVAFVLAKQGLVPHSVHRLDRDTSGVVMIAKHAHSHHLFDIALREGNMHRAYCAIVDHREAFEVPAPNEWNTIDLPIAQNPSSPSRRIISANGQRAVTHYRIVGQTDSASLVQVVLETGRTHQIRLHFSALGMPLVGDAVYGSKRTKPAGRDVISVFPRQALHAYRLSWKHPVYGTHHEADAEPAEDMVSLWAQLGGSPLAWGALVAVNPLLPLSKPV